MFELAAVLVYASALGQRLFAKEATMATGGSNLDLFSQIANLAAQGIALNQPPAPPPVVPPAPPPVVQRTLQPTDLAYLGKFITPLNARSNGAIALRRRPDGTKSLLVAGEDTAQNPLSEVSLPGFSLIAPPTAVLLNSWAPAAWQQGCLSWPASIPVSSGGLQIGGMTMIGQTLYTVFGGHYDVSGGDKPVIFATKFQSDGTLSSVGSWFTQSDNKFSRSWATADPRGNLFVGGGITAGDGGSPWGRSLIALPTLPDLAGVPVYGVLPSVEWLGYPIGHPDIYPGRHVTSPLQPTPVAGGPWINQGAVTTAVWVETPTVVGVLYFGHYGDGFVWYGLNPDPNSTGHYDSVNLSKGYHATEYYGYCAIDNPAKYADVVSGKINPWDPRADTVFDPFPLMGSGTGAGVITPWTLAGGNSFTGAAFDPDTSTLILSGTWEGTGFLGIHAFKVGP